MKREEIETAISYFERIMTSENIRNDEEQEAYDTAIEVMEEKLRNQLD